MPYRPLTRKESLARLKKLEAEYSRALAEIRSLPDGNGFATQQEMRSEVAMVYGGAIAALKRKLGVY